ncbi:MAG: hypothetical protein QF632_06620 [Candidatus Woesearchaeota archaeon]|jgi:hypothetical protein|nr:hypothetical protein [Candidatus Woesearchaeota archaeon]MDP7458040.1 hypothetical protein [Candidatus Woesearchaeota archaeon]
MLNIGIGNCYPEKEVEKSFPYIDPRNKIFIENMNSKGINMKPWLYGWEEILPIEEISNKKQRMRLIQKNIQEIRNKFQQEGIQMSDQDCESETFINEELKKLDDDKKADIKKNINIIKGLKKEGENLKGINKVKVYIELNPLKVLQMGEKVSGSCLSLDGSYGGETITNAVDVNKRVVWAEHNGKILGRVLLAMNDNGKILRFQTYYTNMELDLDTVFKVFVQHLAKKCKTKTSSTGKVSTIIASDWYAGSMAA